MITKAPMAFVLVKFQGTPDEPMNKAEAEQIFTAAGRGTMNVVDWFDDNTHGNVDMTGNAVFGWLELTESVANYASKRNDGTYSRTKIIDLGRAAASAAGVDLSKFTAVVVVTNVNTDLFGGLGHVCCDGITAGVPYWRIHPAPSVLCQEMIHGLGVPDHARKDGSDADYTDRYDVMSMVNALPGHNPSNPDRPVGPGLNAAFMKRCGWLDTTRGASLGQVDLRPLHRRDLPGPLYALVGDYYVEYRPSRRWDTGFASVVLLHYIAKYTSYLIAELRPGSPAFKWGDPSSLWESSGSIKVDAIDDVAEMATVTTSYRPAPSIPFAGPGWSLFQTEFGDAGGVVILGGRIIKIEPRSPELRLAQTAAALSSINEVEVTPALKTALRAELYGQALVEIGEIHEHLTGVSSPLDQITVKAAEEFHRRNAVK